MTTSQKITPCLWFERQALQAAQFYIDVFGGRVTHVHRSSVQTPAAAEGEVLLVEFEVRGLSLQALNGGKHDAFNDAISLSARCADQADVDRLWDRLTADGGRPVQCGWLKDKYGIAWQIVPQRMIELLADPDRARTARAMRAMMQMVKLDIAALERAADGKD